MSESVQDTDVQVEAYEAEKKKWDQTSYDPEAYALGTSWGLLRRSETKWSLFLILNAAQMREMATTESEGIPYLWAREQVDDWDEKRKSAKWEERIIGKRKPGEEGDKGGRLIPMQTFDRKGQKIPQG